MQFTLDLKTLLQVLSRQKQHGLLQADIASDKLHLSGTRQLVHAHIRLESGIVRACAIEERQGESVLEGQNALHLLSEVGVIEWYWTASPPLVPRSPVGEGQGDDASTSSHLPPVTTSIPRRTAQGDEALQTLSRDYRKILALVDGQRSVLRIATVLSMKSEDVVVALRTLQSWGLIF